MVVFKRWSCYFAQMLLKWQLMHQEAGFFSQLPNFVWQRWLENLETGWQHCSSMPVDELGFSL
jgi:hypothetical protein